MASTAGSPGPAVANNRHSKRTYCYAFPTKDWRIFMGHPASAVDANVNKDTTTCVHLSRSKPRANHVPDGVDWLPPCIDVTKPHSTPMKRTQTLEPKLQRVLANCFGLLWSQPSRVRHAKHRGLSVSINRRRPQKKQKKHDGTRNPSTAPHTTRLYLFPTIPYPSHKSTQLSLASKSNNRQGTFSLSRYPDHIHTHRNAINMKLSFQNTTSYCA